MPDANRPSPGTAGLAGREAADAPVPVLLCDTRAPAQSFPVPAGALWKLAQSGRQLDANLIHLPSRQHVAVHTERDLDVLLLVVSGSGTLDTAAGPLSLTAGALLWLPHGSSRSLSADQGGLAYLTVHQRRPGMQIHPRDPAPAPATA